MSDDWTEANQALNFFRKSIESLIADNFRMAEGVAPYQSPIYHYTDVKGALAILRSGRLWFTERRHLNDPVEVRYGLDMGHELFEIAAKNRGATIPKDAASHLKGEHDFGLATYGFWIASFSLDGNDLVQWRNYADEGRGVCLGFSTQAFDMREVARLVPNEPNSLRFAVSYDRDALCKRMQPQIDLALDVLEKADLTARESYDKPFGSALLYERDCFQILNNGFYANSLLHKHPAYRHEQEYRLLISGFRDAICRCEYHGVRERNGEIVSYLDLPIPKWKKEQVLTHIRLGPAASDKLEDQIRTALMTLGISAPKIDPSGIPFRPTR